MQVVLQWQTAQENNSNYFTIQYSQDGNNWSDAGRIIAAGNSDALKTYNFIHTSPVTGKNYYRLQQVDKDYKTAYSGIRYVDFNSPAPAALLSVYPNPVNENTFTVELKHEVQDPLPYTLINIIGKPVQRGFITNQKSVINIGNLNNGTYFLQIGQEKTVKVIKD